MNKDMRVKMNKTIFIICKPELIERNRPIEAFLEEDGIYSIEEKPFEDNISSLQEDILKQSENLVQFITTEKWYDKYQKNFVDLIKEVVIGADHNNTGDVYFSSSYNFFFIELWRLAARKLNLTVKFIVDYQPILSEGLVSKPSELYLMYLALLQNHSRDIHIFHNGDHEASNEFFEHTLSKIVGSASYNAISPAGFLLKNLQFSSIEREKNNLPNELELINSIFRKKRFGSPLVFSDEIRDALKIVDNLHPKSAVFFWLNSLIESLKDNELENKILNYSVQIDLDEIKTAFEDKKRRLRFDNITLKSKLEECTVQNQKVTEHIRILQNKNSTLEKNKNLFLSQKNTNKKGRKLRKLKRDPYAFFNDIKSSINYPFKLLKYLFKKKL
jgi:hypothetical protein